MPGCFGVHGAGIDAPHIVFERIVVGIIFSTVYLAGRYPVAEHLGCIPKGHFYRTDLLLFNVEIGPVFKMMLVSPLWCIQAEE